MTETTTFDYNLSGIDRVTGTSRVGKVITIQQQVGTIKTNYKCKIPEAEDHGYS